MDYEYKFFPAPRQVTGQVGLETDKASFAPTLLRQINLISANGWEFVGREALPVERRAWLILRRSSHEDFLVFRRPLADQVRQKPGLRQTAAPTSEAAVVRPRRVLRNYFPDAQMPDRSTRRAQRATVAGA